MLRVHACIQLDGVFKNYAELKVALYSRVLCNNSQINLPDIDDNTHTVHIQHASLLLEACLMLV